MVGVFGAPRAQDTVARVMQYFGRSRRSVRPDLVKVSRVDSGRALFSLCLNKYCLACAQVCPLHMHPALPPSLRIPLSVFISILCLSGRSGWVSSRPLLVSHCCLRESWALVRVALHASGSPSQLPLGLPSFSRPQFKATGPGELTCQQPYWRWLCFGSSFAARC